MKKLLLLSAMALVSSGALAVTVKPYLEGKISQNWFNVDYKEYGFGKEDFKDNVFGGSLELGLKMEQFRIGLEGYFNDTMEDRMIDILPVELESKGFYLNGYYDFSMCEKLKNLKPYIGGGIGYSWLKATADATGFGLGKDSIKDKDWGWNVGLGVGYEVNQNLDLTLGYRYEDLGEIKDYDSKTDITNHKMSLGLRYTF